jgi:hypothetical protein
MRRLGRRDSRRARPRQIGGFDCQNGVTLSFAKRFIGAENLPTRMSEFDAQQSFCMSADGIAAVASRFRHDRRVAAAIQMLFLRASGRPMDRFASVPKTLLPRSRARIPTISPKPPACGCTNGASSSLGQPPT